VCQKVCQRWTVLTSTCETLCDARDAVNSTQRSQFTLQMQLTVALVNPATLDDSSWRSQLQGHLTVLHAAYDRVVRVVPPAGNAEVQAKFSAYLAALDGSATLVETFLSTRDPSQLRVALGALEASNALLDEATVALAAVKLACGCLSTHSVRSTSGAVFVT